MILHEPFKISARLLPALKVGQDSWISVELVGWTNEGYEPWPKVAVSRESRMRFRYFIDAGKKDLSKKHSRTFTADDLKSGVGGCTLQAAFGSLLAFLGAGAEAYAYEMRNNGRRSENSTMFPPWINEWAYGLSDEIDSLRFEIEEGGKVLIEQEAKADTLHKG